MTASADDIQSRALDQARNARLSRLIDALPQKLPAGPILDLGCGLGAAGPLLKARYGRDIEGVEQDETALESAARTGSYSQLHHGDLIEWEPDYPYALIHAALVFHQCGSIKAMIDWFGQCLVEGGVLAFSLPRNHTSALAQLLHRIAVQQAGNAIAPLPPADGRLEQLHQWLAPHGAVTIFSHEELRPLPPSQIGHPLRLVMEESFIRPMLKNLSPEQVETVISAMDEALEQSYPTMPSGHVIRLRETYAVLQLAV